MNDLTIERRQRQASLMEMAPEPCVGTDLTEAERCDCATTARVDREVVLAGWMPTLRLLVLRRGFWLGMVVGAGWGRLEPVVGVLFRR